MRETIYYFLTGIFFALPANAKTIADHLLDTYNAKQAILTAINAKGGGLTTSTAFRNYIPGIERMCAGTATTAEIPKYSDGTIGAELAELASTKDRIAAALTAKGITLSENAGLLNYGPAIAERSCCTAGTYSTGGLNPCENCGIGHYCTGGAQRTACTYGTQACVGTNHTYDVQFICPIVENMLGNGSIYYPMSYGSSCTSDKDCYTTSSDGNWRVTGPWGSGATDITVYGQSRCSTTSGITSQGSIGTPEAGDGSGGYCWCRVKDSSGSNFGAWVSQDISSSASGCAHSCSAGCAYDAMAGKGYRAALCTPPQAGT
jgi:hypothetical protein